jgi:hypothetical protein
MTKEDEDFQKKFMEEWEKLQTPQPLNMILPLRILIIIISCILIGLIWICVIPWSLIFGIWLGPLHSYDSIMEPYYWLDMCWKNKKF